jgi:hypothetical protein
MELLTDVLIKSPLWPSPFFQKFEWEIFMLPCGNCSVNGMVLGAIPQPFFISSHLKHWWLPLWACHSSVVSSVSTFFFNPLKCGSINHVGCTITIRTYVLHHSMWQCTLSCASLHYAKAPSHKQHFKRAFKLEQECRYPIPPPLECFLDNLIAITCFRSSLLEWYTLNPKLHWYNLATTSNTLKDIVNPPAPLAHQKALDRVSLPHWFR